MKTVIALLFLVLFVSVSIASAATCRVTKAADTNDGSCDAGDCSLREAVAEPSCALIDFSLDLAGHTIGLTLGEVVIGRSVAIRGWGADATVISGNNLSRVFRTNLGTDVTISGVTITGGNVPVNQSGAAVVGSGRLTLDGVYITGNNGRALSFGGTYGSIVINSTIAGNSGIGTLDPVKVFNSTICNNGGGAYLFDTTTVVNSTFVNNAPESFFIDLGTLDPSNSIVKDINIWEFFGWAHSGGYNIFSLTPQSFEHIILQPSDRVDVDPQLLPLGYYGGHMPTMMPVSGGASVDGGNNTLAINAGLTTDQRGYSRFADGDGNGTATSDNGAVEFGATPPPPVTVAGRVFGAVSGNPVRSQTVAITDMLGNTRTAISSSLGWFVFDNLPVSFVYRVSVKGRRGVQYKTIFADQDMSDVDIFVPGL